MIRMMRSLVVAALVGGALIGGSGSASAAGTSSASCGQWDLNPNGATAICSGLSSIEQYRVWVYCSNGSGTYYAYGPWRNWAGFASTVYCNQSSHSRLSYGSTLERFLG
ncbi:hypothetical protein [Pseudonocardia sp. GCM10023141]|uniref:hypothetical protein n=1 Tax=Pseudonocardia sp. GCM10023141 TaxID=3252653 RepID=UPI003620211A